MATSRTKSGASENGARATAEDLYADIEQIKADIAKLAAQFQTTGEHSYGAARRAATQGAEQLRAQGEAAIESLRASASDIEKQLAQSVRDKPVTALAVAAGIGFLFALLSRR